ncbi:MAG: NADH-quinone oxidoreductase subunit A [Nitrospinota bacterium]|nr:NADH-quinone oxidoreductase subunit A [Nitrospinota bacterium]
MSQGFLPIFMMIGLATCFAILNICITFLFGRRTPSLQKSVAYECGIIPETSARGRFSIKFFLVAILFIVFDVEIIFLYQWAVNLRSLGVFGFMAVLPFIFLLFASLIYEWKRGALDWD